MELLYFLFGPLLLLVVFICADMRGGPTLQTAAESGDQATLQTSRTAPSVRFANSPLPRVVTTTSPGACCGRSPRPLCLTMKAISVPFGDQAWLKARRCSSPVTT